MKKFFALFLTAVLLFSVASAVERNDAGTQYTLKTKGHVVLQLQNDRSIKPAPGALDLNPVISGESPTTGLPYNTDSLYMPMIIQISNPEGTAKDMNGKKVTSAGVGERAPWGGQHADIVYEGILYRSGQTRISFLLSDVFSEYTSVSVGPVRSARLGHALLREEWGGGIAYSGGPRAVGNNLEETFKLLGADKKGVTFSMETSAYGSYFQRVKGVKAPDNVDVDAYALRSLIPSSTVATPHPFLFTDVSPYVDGYDMAYTIHLDWGHKRYISSFEYDEANNIYLRFSNGAPYNTFGSADDRSADNMEQLSFSNVIIQRVHYEYANGNKIMPLMQGVGQWVDVGKGVKELRDGPAMGNADIFIGGRYIPGYWVRESISSPTVYLDDHGNQIQLTRGKTFIAHFPPESLLTYER